MDALDGNAIAGALYDYFGAEMTAARGVCAHCGAPATLAEQPVYMRAPGAVVRCWHCGFVVIVIVSAGDVTHLDCSEFKFVTMPAGAG